ncbi:uncharacterized protein SPSK_03660 [Sporothrix schenckii 1099-18]|uniref:Uncharacterized protein n=1 Tax=Sporothrix schenckii 1099-18 TaxID=1397361 RepID=A0A0F2M1U3_SPOSC|nr:uncharacterized protein SPSK_03660 [Sporothrix schenckii 1099-18]KJR82730.1 hypothetical protein SPSK_03660 [Sporothrix schenckii 1099-18]
MYFSVDWDHADLMHIFDLGQLAESTQNPKRPWDLPLPLVPERNKKRTKAGLRPAAQMPKEANGVSLAAPVIGDPPCACPYPYPGRWVWDGMMCNKLVLILVLVQVLRSCFWYGLRGSPLYYVVVVLRRSCVDTAGQMQLARLKQPDAPSMLRRCLLFNPRRSKSANDTKGRDETMGPKGRPSLHLA